MLHPIRVTPPVASSSARNPRILFGVLTSTLIALAPACQGATTTKLSTCVPGEQVACVCGASTVGTQVCASDGTYGACSCSGDAGTADAGGDAGGCVADASAPVDTYFDVDVLQIPVSGTTVLDGFNLDGVDSPVQDAPGCYVQDSLAPGALIPGVDDALASLVGAAYGLNLSQNVQASVAPVTGAPHLRVRISLAQWNGTADDDCVAVDVGIAVGSALVFTHTNRVATRLVAGVTPAFSIPDPVTLDVAVKNFGCTPYTVASGNAEAAACGAGYAVTCAGHLPVTLTNVRARLHLDALPGGVFRLLTNHPVDGFTSVVAPTMIGGYAHMWTTADCGTTSPGTFSDALRTLLCDIGDGAGWSSLCSSVRAGLDLRTDASGALVSCSPGLSSSTKDATGLSTAFYVGSGYDQ